MARVPDRYLEIIVQALAGLRAKKTKFLNEDIALVFGAANVRGRRLPASTDRADCIKWVESLTPAALECIAEHGRLFPDSTVRKAIWSYARQRRLLAAESLAHVSSLVIVDRERLLSNLKQVDDGQFRIVRVDGQRGSGITFTASVLEDLVGANRGGDHRVIKINLAHYTEDVLKQITLDLLEPWRKQNKSDIKLPVQGDAAKDKYIEQLAELVIDSYRQLPKPPECTWIVFDRCGEADASEHLRSYLRAIAMAVEKFRDDPDCPRVLFLEASPETLARFRPLMAVEELGPVTEAELRLYCARRKLQPDKIDKLAADLNAPIEGFERLETMHMTIREELMNAPPPRPGPPRAPSAAKADKGKGKGKNGKGGGK